MLAVIIVRVRIGIASDFRDRIKGALRRRVVTEHAVAFLHLLQSAHRVRFGARPMPHLFPFNEKSVPVVMMRVGAEDPIMSCLRGRSGHRHAILAQYTRTPSESQTKCEG